MVAAGSIAVAVLFAAGVIGFTRVLPALTDRPEQVSTVMPAPPVTPAEADRYSGVARLDSGLPCTAVLLDTAVSAAPGYLLTSGRCAPGDGPAGIATDQPASGTAIFGLAPGRVLVEVPVVRLAYQSRHGTDLAVLELGASLGSLQEHGLRAYPAVSVGAASGQPVSSVAIPVAGVDREDVGLRRGTCRLGPRVDLIEAGWVIDDVHATTCPGPVRGSFGSPLFDGRDHLVGLALTSTAGALPGGACSLGVPCERAAAGVRVVPARGYATSVARLGACFSAGRFALAGTCPLPRPGLSLGLAKSTYRSADLAGGHRVPVSVRAPLTTRVRIGVAPVSAAPVCLHTGVYSGRAVAKPAGGPPYGLRLPAREGRYLVCAALPGREAAAAQAVLEVDDTPPVRTPVLAVRPHGDGYRIRPVTSPPELTGYRLKVGPVAGTECADPTGYIAFRGQPVQVAGSRLPARVCLLGYDRAGNEAAPWSQDLTPR